ncbi:hypothetical protein [Turicimonas muris]|uniref:hypothetical protein n=1 Tax=Turicimonas muris TaxID=1796652 RepID=UPI00248D0F48|nr:hypothetical protein [Turicimonas muris]
MKIRTRQRLCKMQRIKTRAEEAQMNEEERKAASQRFANRLRELDAQRLRRISTSWTVERIFCLFLAIFIIASVLATVFVAVARL